MADFPTEFSEETLARIYWDARQRGFEIVRNGYGIIRYNSNPILPIRVCYIGMAGEFEADPDSWTSYYTAKGGELVPVPGRTKHPGQIIEFSGENWIAEFFAGLDIDTPDTFRVYRVERGEVPPQRLLQWRAFAGDREAFVEDMMLAKLVV